jgi:hypothetical protein
MASTAFSCSSCSSSPSLSCSSSLPASSSLPFPPITPTSTLTNSSIAKYPFKLSSVDILRISDRSCNAMSRVEGSAVGFMLFRIVFKRVPREAMYAPNWKVPEEDMSDARVCSSAGGGVCCEGGVGFGGVEMDAFSFAVVVVFAVAFDASLVTVFIGVGMVDEDPAPAVVDDSAMIMSSAVELSFLIIGTSIVSASSSSSSPSSFLSPTLDIDRSIIPFFESSSSI